MPCLHVCAHKLEPRVLQAKPGQACWIQPDVVAGSATASERRNGYGEARIVAYLSGEMGLTLPQSTVSPAHTHLATNARLHRRCNKKAV